MTNPFNNDRQWIRRCKVEELQHEKNQKNAVTMRRQNDT